MSSERKKEFLVVIGGFLTWGFSILMRNSFGYYVDDLSLTSTQTGIANAVLSASVCVSAIVVSAIAEKKNRIFCSLGLMLFVAAIGTFLLAETTNFGLILVSRVIVGIGCGPVFSLLMKSVELVSSKDSYPRDTGLVSNGEPWISTILGPIVIVWLLNHVGMRNTNYVFAVILLFLGILWIVMSRKEGRPECVTETADRLAEQEKNETRENRENREAEDSRKKGAGVIWTHMKDRRLMLCLAGGALNLVACWCIFMYVPTLLQQEGNLSSTSMSYAMTGMGVFMAVGMVVFPEWYGRKKSKSIILLGCVLSAVGLGAITVWPGNAAAVALYILFGGLSSVMSLFFMAIISVEKIGPAMTASALALVNGGCELFGSCLGPLLAGYLSDRTNIRVSMLISMTCMLLSAVVIFVIQRMDQRN